MSKKWTDEEILFLKKNYKILSLKEIADRLGRPYKSVKFKKFKLQLSPLNVRAKFSEDDFLQAIASSRSFKEAAIKLGYRGSSFGWYGAGKKSSLFNKLLNKLNPDISHFTERSKRPSRHLNKNFTNDLKIFNILSEVYSNYKRRCKHRKREFALSKDEFYKLCLSNCFYCGSSGNTIVRGQKINICGIDRLDSSIGYLKINCVPCCKICNFMKRKSTKDDFINQAVKIADHQRSLQSADTNQEIQTTKNPISSDLLSCEPNEHSLEHSLSLDQYDQ